MQSGFTTPTCCRVPSRQRRARVQAPGVNVPVRLLVATLAISACTVGLDPGGAADVPEATTTTALVTATNLGTVATRPSISCDITLTTTFAGSKDEQVAWESVIFRFFAWLDRSGKVDSQTLTANQQKDAWCGPPSLGSNTSFW